MMKQEDVVSFCQFLMRHKQITVETARLVHQEYQKHPLTGGKLSILHQGNATPRSGAILIVQHLAQTAGLWLGTSCEPVRLAELWMRSPLAQYSPEDFETLMRGEVPMAQPRLFPVDADTVAGAPAKLGSYIAPRKASARLAQVEAGAPPLPKLINVGKHLVPAKLGPYLVESQIGEGGMGAVFLVRHERTGLPFALKLKLSPNQDPEAAKLEDERFVREAKAMLMVTSPYVARAYELGEGAGEQYLVMEHIRGKDLTATVKQLPANDPLAVVRLVRDAAKGVQAFHAAGLIHRDIKPSNVMVDESGCPKVIDSGLVRSISGPDETPTKPGTLPTEADLTNGVMVGTPQFLAPEQALSNPITPACDVYSLAKTLYHLLTGKHVHEGTVMNILLHVCKDEPLPEAVMKPIKLRLPFGGASARMIAILTKALAFRPQDRYQNAEDFVQALDEFLSWWAGRLAQAEAAKEAEFATQAAKYRRVVIGLAVTAILTVCSLTVAILFDKSRREATGRAEAESRANREAQGRAEAEARAHRDAQSRAEAEARRANAESLKATVAVQFQECQALMRSAQWARAEQALRALIERDGSFEPARYEMARVQFNLRQVSCAEQMEWLALNGSATRRSEYAFYTLFYREELDPKHSTDAYRDVLNRITDRNYRAMAEAYLMMGEAESASRRQDADATKRLLEQAQERIPTLDSQHELAWLASGLKGFATWRMALSLPAQQQNARLTEAMLLLNQSVGRNPDFPMTWQWLGMVWRHLNHFGAAMAAFERLECLMAGWGMPRYMKQDCRLLLAAQLAPATQLAIADEAKQVCEDVIRVGGLEARQHLMARMVLMRARLARSVACASLGRRADEQAEVQEVFRLAEELSREPNLLPDESAYLSRILSKRPK